MKSAFTRSPEARAEIFAALRRARSQAQTQPLPALHEKVIRQASPATPEKLWEEFARRVERLGDRAIRAASRKEARAVLEQAIRERAGALGIADAAALRALGLNRESEEPWVPGGARIVSPGDRETAFRADFGLILADLAVAETGSVVLSLGPGRSRLASLAPPVCFVLAPFPALVPDTLDALTRQAELSPAGGAGVWITGSSRTADIEGILIRGAHGPRELLILGLPDA